MLFRLSTTFRTDATGKRLPDVMEPDIEVAARYYRARDRAAAAQVCDAILLRQPQDFNALHLRGVLLLEQERLEEALEFLRLAEHQRPDEPQLQSHIGDTLLAQQKFAEAADAFRRSLALRPGNYDALNNLGSALSNNLRYEEAITCLRQALAIRPDAPPALYNLGRALLALGRLEEAAESFRAAMAFVGPETEAARLIDLYNSLNEVLIQLRRYDEALAVCRNAPAAIRDAPALQWNESLTLLMLEDFAAGWRKYECRFLVPDHDPPRDGAAPLDLDRVTGKRVLVFPEQGRGDMIQFARYLPLLAARGAHVLVEIYPDLKPLFDTIDGIERVVTPDDDPPDHDLLTALLSLPSAFGTTLATVPSQVPYLRVPLDRLARWRELLGPRTGVRIGVASVRCPTAVTADPPCRPRRWNRC